MDLLYILNERRRVEITFPYEYTRTAEETNSSSLIYSIKISN